MNSRETSKCWQPKGQLVSDEHFPANERFPRQAILHFRMINVDHAEPIVQLYLGGRQLGTNVKDIAYDTQSNYRYHDVFHFGIATILGWSPVARWMIGCNRKSNPMIDATEDGSKAKLFEECISYMVADYAGKHNHLLDVEIIDHGLLSTIKQITANLEVQICTKDDWQAAIFQICAVWRELITNNGGCVALDFDKRTIVFSTCP